LNGSDDLPVAAQRLTREHMRAAIDGHAALLANAHAAQRGARLAADRPACAFRARTADGERGGHGRALRDFDWRAVDFDANM
jgi:hypothetical protein